MEEKSISNNAVMNHALRAGLILGLVLIISTLIVYFIDRGSIASFQFGLLNILIYILFPIFTLLNLRKSNEGYIDFKYAFIDSFFTCFNAAILTSIFTYVLYNYMDTDLAGFIREKMVEKTTSMLENMNIPQEEIDKQIEKLEETNLEYGLVPIIKGLTYQGIIAAVYSLILAAIFKRSRPIEF